MKHVSHSLNICHAGQVSVQSDSCAARLGHHMRHQQGLQPQP